MAARKKGKSGWGGDQEHREVDFEVKNLLIDLVRQHLVDTFRRKVDKSGSAGVPLNDKVLQWRFWDRMSFLKDYIVNRKLVKNYLHSVQ